MGDYASRSPVGVCVTRCLAAASTSTRARKVGIATVATSPASDRRCTTPRAAYGEIFQASSGSASNTTIGPGRATRARARAPSTEQSGTSTTAVCGSGRTLLATATAIS
jgi:hypothetical protein